MIAADPKAGTTLRPARPSTWWSARARSRSRSRDWTGKDADEAETALDEARASRSTRTEENTDTVAEGDVISQDPTQRHPLQGRHGRARRLQGPRAGRGARRSSAWASTPRPQTLEAPASRSTTEEAADYIGLGYVVTSTPGRADGAQGQHGHALHRLTADLAGGRPVDPDACPSPCAHAVAPRPPPAQPGRHPRAGRQGAGRRARSRAPRELGCETLQVFVGNPRGWALLGRRRRPRTRRSGRPAPSAGCGCSSTRRTS